MPSGGAQRSNGFAIEPACRTSLERILARSRTARMMPSGSDGVRYRLAAGGASGASVARADYATSTTPRTPSAACRDEGILGPTVQGRQPRTFEDGSSWFVTKVKAEG
jgi:hypothetical protein